MNFELHFEIFYKNLVFNLIFDPHSVELPFPNREKYIFPFICVPRGSFYLLLCNFFHLSAFIYLSYISDDKLILTFSTHAHKRFIAWM